MSAAIVIPARYGSTRFPGKPLALIAGKTLIQRVWERAQETRRAKAVWIATDDDRIEDHARGFGALVARTGEAETGTDRIALALDRIEREEGRQFSSVVNVQGDEPLIEMEAVDRMIDVLEAGEADLVTLSCPLRSEAEFLSPDVVKVVTTLDGYALYFSRSPIPHAGAAVARRHVGLYGYRTEALRRFTALPPSPLERVERLEQLRALQNGFKIRLLETDAPHRGVDRPDDIAEIERELAEHHARS